MLGQQPIGDKVPGVERSGVLERLQGEPVQKIAPEAIASLIETVNQQELNKEALDYAINLVGASNDRLKKNLFVHNITNPKFMKGLKPSEDDLKAMRELLDSMRFDNFADEKRFSSEKQREGLQYLEKPLVYFGKTREMKARELVRIIVRLINEKTQEEFTQVLAGTSQSH